MNKSNLSRAVKNLQRTTKKHSPEILVGIGIAGMITTVVMAVRATPKAVELLVEETQNRILSNDRDGEENIEGLIKVSDDESGYYYRLPVKDAIKTTWLCYVPATVVGSISIACIIFANSAHMRRNTALATAYSFSETALREYQDKAKEIIGVKKEQQIRDSLNRDCIDRNPLSNKEVFMTKNGDMLCYDKLSGRYFKSDINEIKKVINVLNKRMLTDMAVSLNELYYEIGLPGIKLGDDLGWDIDMGFIDIEFSSQLAEDGTPCLVLDYKVAPQYDYRIYG